MPVPTFGSIGKKIKDLLTKKYDTKVNQLSTKQQSAGLSVESGFKHDGAVTGYVTAKFSDKAVGESELNLNTVGTASTSAKFTSLAKGLTVEAKGGVDPAHKDKDYQSLALSASAEYSEDFVTATVKAESLASKYKVEATGVVGAEGLNVGGQVVAEVVGTSFKVADANFGVEYSQGPYVAALKSEKFADKYTLSYFHKVNASTLGGVSLLLDPSSKEAEKTRVLTVGVEHNVDATTLVKGKLDSTGVASALVQHTLSNPKLQLALAADFKVTGATPFQATTYGVNLAFGDF